MSGVALVYFPVCPQLSRMSCFLTFAPFLSVDPHREKEHAEGYVDMLENHFTTICLSQVCAQDRGREADRFSAVLSTVYCKLFFFAVHDNSFRRHARTADAGRKYRHRSTRNCFPARGQTIACAFGDESI